FIDREVVDPDRPLEASLWDVEAWIGGELAFVGGHEGPATLELVDGTARISTPCADGTASYVIDGASLKLSDVAIGYQVCPADECSSMYDAQMREVLVDGVLEWEIDADRLTLMRGDVGLILRTD